MVIDNCHASEVLPIEIPKCHLPPPIATGMNAQMASECKKDHPMRYAYFLVSNDCLDREIIVDKRSSHKKA